MTNNELFDSFCDNLGDMLKEFAAIKNRIESEAIPNAKELEELKQKTGKTALELLRCKKNLEILHEAYESKYKIMLEQCEYFGITEPQLEKFLVTKKDMKKEANA